MYVADAPGGPRVLSWSWDHTLRWWDAATSMPIGEPMWHDGPVMGSQQPRFAAGIRNCQLFPTRQLLAIEQPNQSQEGRFSLQSINCYPPGSAPPSSELCLGV
jgi:hypothetical protein